MISTTGGGGGRDCTGDGGGGEANKMGDGGGEGNNTGFGRGVCSGGGYPTGVGIRVSSYSYSPVGLYAYSAGTATGLPPLPGSTEGGGDGVRDGGLLPPPNPVIYIYII